MLANAIILLHTTASQKSDAPLYLLNLSINSRPNQPQHRLLFLRYIWEDTGMTLDEIHTGQGIRLAISNYT